MKSLFVVLVVVLFVVEPCWAHGGTYRPPTYGGPGDTAPRAPGPGGGGRSGPTGPSPGLAGPTTPAGPVAPRAPTPLPPMTPGKDEVPPYALWQVWWSYNDDALLDLRGRLQAAATSSEGNRVVAARRELQQQLGPALGRILDSGDKESVMRQVLIALARLERVPGVDVGALERLRLFHLGRNSPNLQEAALVSFGVAGDGAATDLLRHVLADDAEGRKLVGSETAIAARSRAFAAYSLGLVGSHADSEPARRPIVHALLHALGLESGVEREVRVACALGLGLVPISNCTTREESQDPAHQIEELHLCGGAQCEYLLGIASDAHLDPWFRGHAAASLGKLAVHAGAGFPATDDHPASLARDELVRALCDLTEGARGLTPVLEGGLIGLAFVVDGDGDEVDVRARELLKECTSRDEPMSQRLALLALATALGRPGTGKEPDAGWKAGQTFLLREFGRARGERLAWTALALAVAGHGRIASGVEYPGGLVDALRVQLGEVREDDVAAACALALAVLRSEDASVDSALLKAFDRHTGAAFRAKGAIALGFLGVSDAQKRLETMLDDPAATLEQTLGASVGLRLLGDPDVVPDLVKRLARKDAKVEDALAIVHTLALLQDPAAGKLLLPLVADVERDENVRAAMVWCLGSISEPDSPDWTAVYANGLAYNYLPRTLRSPLSDGRGLLDWRWIYP